MTYRSGSARARVFDDALREAMDATVTESGAVEVPATTPPAAGTPRPEPDPSKVMGDGGIVDSDPHGAYGDGVEDAHTLDGLSGGHKSRLHSLTPSAESALARDGEPLGGAATREERAARAENLRLSRLRLWQAQR